MLPPRYPVFGIVANEMLLANNALRYAIAAAVRTAESTSSAWLMNTM